jgi:(2Fe-2S) ferredoxin
MSCCRIFAQTPYHAPPNHHTDQFPSYFWRACASGTSLGGLVLLSRHVSWHRKHHKLSHRVCVPSHPAGNVNLPSTMPTGTTGPCSSTPLGASPCVLRLGNVYPALSQEQLELLLLRRQRLASNCSHQQLSDLAARAHSHQAKHVLLCDGSCGCGSCSGRQTGALCWDYLEARLAELNQLRTEGEAEPPIKASRVPCEQLRRILPVHARAWPCKGPIALVLPELVWYERLSPLVMEMIIEQHLLGGCVVANHELPGPEFAGRRQDGDVEGSGDAAAEAAAADATTAAARMQQQSRQQQQRRRDAAEAALRGHHLHSVLPALDITRCVYFCCCCCCL